MSTSGLLLADAKGIYGDGYVSAETVGAGPVAAIAAIAYVLRSARWRKEDRCLGTL